MRKRQTNQAKVILQSRDGDYVERVESTEWETVKMFFVFTNDRVKARVFTWDELFPRNATTSIGTEWTHGFGGGKITPL